MLRRSIEWKVVKSVIYRPGDMRPRQRTTRAILKARAKPSEDPNVRPEGDKGLVWDALNFMYHLRIAFTQLEDDFARIKYLTKKACDHSINDSDRGLINRQLQSAIRNYDQNVRELKVLGIPFFTGEYAKEPQVLPLVNPRSDREQIDIKVASDNWTADGLGLSKTRVDNFVNARKAEGMVDKCILAIKAYHEYIDQKDHFLSLHRKTIEMSAPDFGSVKSGKLIDLADDEQLLDEEDLESRDPDLIRLRKIQEQVAKKEGRESGLLLNLVS